MKPGAVLVNASRGPVANQTALTKTLQDNRIAGTDVLVDKPPKSDDPLLTLESVVLTLHSGHGHIYPQEFCEAFVEALIDLANGRLPASVVNPEAIPNARIGRKELQPI